MFKYALFFTRGVSLEKWFKMGLLDREKSIYERLINEKKVICVYWFTYGVNDDSLAEQLKLEGKLNSNIYVCSKPRFFSVFGPLGDWIYSFCIPLFFMKVLKNVDFLKSNQIDGSWSALIAKLIFKKKFILRSGYILSQINAVIFKRRKIYNFILNILERIVVEKSDFICVASYHNKKYLINKYHIKSSQIEVLPNYVDVNKFKPVKNNRKFNNRFVFVGRLIKVKNIINLIIATQNNGYELDIYGDGPMESEIRKLLENDSHIRLMGVVSNDDLPFVLNKYDFFILPSISEGMPKALLEGMACGLLCIGTNVIGINEIISDDINGILACGTDVKSIQKAQQRAVDSKINKKQIIDNALEMICLKYSLSNVVKQEFIILKKLRKI